MSNKNQKLIPKLRFPEFRETADWTPTTLGKLVVSESSNLALNKLTLNDVGYPVYGADGCVGYIDKFAQKYDYIAIIKDGSGVGRLSIYKGRSSVLGTLAYLKPSHDSETILDWLFYRLASIDLKKHVKGSGIPHIYYSDYSNEPTAIPSYPEQQKIADCLSSLDELITAHNQKVEALKQHKKGLMQQLFPAEGETVPKLRFPEFENDEEWVHVELNKLGELISGLTYSPEDIREAGLLVLRSSNVQNGQISLDDNVYVKSSIKGANLAKPNDILICVRNGSKALIGKNALIPDGMPLCTHGAFMTVFRSSTPRFVFQLFQTNAYQKQVDGDLGATINSINGSKFLKYEFYVPKELEEQQKIADFLSSIDELIFTQTQQLEAYKAHKKGLMQQLFPALEEVA